MSRDVQARFHEEWLGLAQPYEGLVFSVPVLADAQIMPQSGPELSARFRQALIFARHDGPGRFGDLRAFFEDFLGYSASGALIARAELPEDLHFYAHEGRQDLRPSFAILRRPTATTDDLFAGFGEASEAHVLSEGSNSSPYICATTFLQAQPNSHSISRKMRRVRGATHQARSLNACFGLPLCTSALCAMGKTYGLSTHPQANPLRT
jgi:hypothetical protein